MAKSGADYTALAELAKLGEVPSTTLDNSGELSEVEGDLDNLIQRATEIRDVVIKVNAALAEL